MALKKWLGSGVLLAALLVVWGLYAANGSKLAALDQRIEATQNADDPEGVLEEMQGQRDTLEGQRIFNGILLAFLCAGVCGILFVIYVLPVIAHRMTHAVYDSAEEAEPDPMHDARSLLAQGDYDGAIEAFKLAAGQQPLNRVPWVEISKIQKDHQHDPMAAIQTIRTALEGQEWEINDAAFFLFRLAEMYDESANDRATAVTMLKQVIEQFPETRHSANARHKLHEWAVV